MKKKCVFRRLNKIKTDVAKKLVPSTFGAWETLFLIEAFVTTEPLKRTLSRYHFFVGNFIKS